MLASAAVRSDKNLANNNVGEVVTLGGGLCRVVSGEMTHKFRAVRKYRRAGFFSFM